ncbi:MAG: ABC transporter permease [Gammaproteobacteria bacterium]
MKTGVLFWLALGSMRKTPARTVLTALGIVIGVAAVIATISIGEGAQVRVQESLSRPESRVVYLAAVVPRNRWRTGAEKLKQNDRLSVKDYFALKASLGHTSAVSPSIYVPVAHVEALGRATDAILEGLDVGGFKLGGYGTRPRTVVVGSVFSDSDVRKRATVCVITLSLANELYPFVTALNRVITVQGVPFAIVGILDDEDFGNPLIPNARDFHIFVPYTSLAARLDRLADMTIRAQAEDVEHVDFLKNSMSDLIERRRAGREAEFRIISAADSIQAYSEGSRAIARLLAAVAAVSLIVGGVGIMNIMLVSVVERTREIGVRMAIGTRCKDVLRQFLLEATVLGFLGSSVGLAVGVAATAFVAWLNDWPVRVTLPSMATALFCGVVVSICFGYRPAYRAASLLPIQALRAEP